jgi:hypothetical protein
MSPAGGDPVETWEWIALGLGIAALALAVALVVALVVHRRRRRHLKERFGTEYDRAVVAAGKRDAERQLTDVERKHEDLEIRTLPAPARDRYLEEWRQVEARFVSDPTDAVRAGERIVFRVLEDRGYPVDGDVDERVALVAADYPDVVQRYRHATEMVQAAEQSTENLRRALVDLRMVVDELLVRERPAA